MRKTAVLFVLLAAAGLMAVVFAACEPTKPPQSKDIVWVDFESGTKLAQKDNLPMMIHYTATWSVGCRKLGQEVYTMPEVVQLSRSFVCVKVDGDKEKELAARYKVEGYPTIIFTNSSGEEVHRVGEFMPADKFIAQMKVALQKRSDAEAADKNDTRKAE